MPPAGDDLRFEAVRVNGGSSGPANRTDDQDLLHEHLLADDRPILGGGRAGRKYAHARAKKSRQNGARAGFETPGLSPAEVAAKIEIVSRTKKPARYRKMHGFEAKHVSANGQAV